MRGLRTDYGLEGGDPDGNTPPGPSTPTTPLAEVPAAPAPVSGEPAVSGATSSSEAVVTGGSPSDASPGKPVTDVPSYAAAAGSVPAEPPREPPSQPVAPAPPGEPESVASWIFASSEPPALAAPIQPESPAAWIFGSSEAAPPGEATALPPPETPSSAPREPETSETVRYVLRQLGARTPSDPPADQPKSVPAPPDAPEAIDASARPISPDPFAAPPLSPAKVLADLIAAADVRAVSDSPPPEATLEPAPRPRSERPGFTRRELPKPPASFVPTGSTPLVRALEARVAQAAAGAPGGLVLAQAATTDELRGALAQLWHTTAARSIHINVPAGAEPTQASVHALVEALTVRGPRSPEHAPEAAPDAGVRPGAAALVDPLVARAAAFVLAPDETSSIGVYLTPEALDESPAVAARLLARRFLPAFAAQMPLVPLALMAALLRARCGGPEDAPDFATVAADLGPAAFLGALGALAARAGVAIVLLFEGGLETPAATAHLALEVPIGPAFALIVPVEHAAWEAQRVLLSEPERVRAEERIVDGTVLDSPAAAAPQPIASVAAPATPAPATPGTPVDPAVAAAAARGTPRARAAARRKGESSASMPAVPGTPATAQSAANVVPPAQPGSAAFQEQLRRAVAARLAKPDPAKPGAPVDPALAALAGAPAAAPVTPPPSRPAKWDVSRGPSRMQKVLLGVAPFVFLAALPILGRMEPEARRSGSTPSRVTQPTPPTQPVKTDGPKLEPGKPDPGKPQTGPKLAAPTPRPANPAPQKQARQPQPAPPPQPGVQQVTPGVPPQLSRAENVLREIEQDLQSPPPGGPGQVLDRRLGSLDREEQAKTLVKLLERGTPGSDPLRTAVIERMGPLDDVPAISERLAGLLQPASPRNERIAGLQTIQRAPASMSSELRATVTALAHGDADVAVETQAQAILLALGDTSVPGPGGQPPANPAANPDPNGAPPWPPADPYNPQPPPR